MNKPYLPMQFDELKLIKKADFLRWSSPRIKTVGKIFGNALPRKGLKKKPKLQKEDKIGLIDIQQYKNQPIANWKDSLIVLDFDLVPDMPRTLYNASTVQVLGEISEIQNNFLYMTVHFVRDFSAINVDRYLEAIGKQYPIQDIEDIQYPNIYLRRQMIDTILSPSSCALLSNTPLLQSYISEKDFVKPMNISKNLFEDADEVPSSAEKELVVPSSGKIRNDDFAAHRWLKDLTSEDIYDQIEPEIFKNSSVTAPQKVDFGPQKTKLQNYSAKTLMEKKNRRINTKNTFETTANSNFRKHSQDDPKTLPRFAPTGCLILKRVILKGSKG